MSEDVCEWRLRIGGMFKTSCEAYPEEYPDNGVCPYCKKPIKIVEEE